MSRLYEVPVWFTIPADSLERAEERVRDILREMECYDQLPDHVVGEALPLRINEGAPDADV